MLSQKADVLPGLSQNKGYFSGKAYFMKRIFILLSFTCISPCLLSAQEETPAAAATANPNKAQQFSISVNGGMTFAFTDVNESKSAPVFGIGAQYAPKPWVAINAELQAGTLKSGDRSKAALSYMEFKNNFFYGAVTGRFYPLRLILTKNTDADVKTNIKYLGGLYAGFGLGFIANKTEAFKTPVADAGYITDPDGLELVMPLEIGYSLPLAHLNPAYAKNVYGKSLLSLNINYRHNLGFSEKMDGYNPAGYNNKSKDAFGSLTLGLIYNF